MSFNYSKLEGRIVEKYGSQMAFAAAVNMSQDQLSRRLNGKTPFRGDEIATAASVLGIEPENICEYFFAREVR